LAPLEDQHAAVSARREECNAPGVQVRGVRRGVVVWSASEEVRQLAKVCTKGHPMSRRLLASTAALAAVPLVALLAQAPAAGQTPSSAPKATTGEKAWTPPRTADGKPDLQGIWSNNTLTPFERPKSLGAKECYTDQELADLTKRVHEGSQGEEVEG